MTDRRVFAYFVAALALSALVYIPGLHGGFVFDDYPNIVNNEAVHVTTANGSNWLRALWSSPASDLQRPLASFTFALNHYFTGLDPFPMKAFNLGVHLLNGLLIFLLLRALLAVSPEEPRSAPNETSPHAAWLALLVSSAWLLHPINLTGVLYVVQRMESLAQIFVLTGLLLYVSARRRQSIGRSGATWRLWLGVPACMLLGTCAKESAVLLPLYALLVELTVLRKTKHPRNAIAAFFAIFLLVPGVLGAWWIIPGALSDGAYSTRIFTLGQRLLTEPRVVMDYATQILLPLPKLFSFYHDDYVISTDLWHPWTTLPAIVALGAAACGAWLLRRRRPLVTLGVAWFLGAHVLTATVIPLELMFEHRNYFASIGLLVAAIDLLLPRDVATARLVYVRLGWIGVFIALATGTLWLRSLEWGSPIQLAMGEATRHPQSPRATFDLGRSLFVISGYREDSPNLQRGFDTLETAARVPRASILPEVRMIMTAAATARNVKSEWWDSIQQKLHDRAPTVEDADAINALTECQRQGKCPINDQRMLDIYLAAVNHPSPNPAFLYSYAIFAFNRLHDPDLALRLARDAAQSHDRQYQVNLVNFMIDLGRYEEATTELQGLKARAPAGSMDALIEAAEARLQAGQKARPTKQ